MKDYTKKTIAIFFIFVMVSTMFLFQMPVYAESTVEKNVLILNSDGNESNIIFGYQSKDWISEIISSINSEFVNSKKNINVKMRLYGFK